MHRNVLYINLNVNEHNGAHYVTKQAEHIHK